MSADIDCPYCEKGIDINHDDGDGYAEGETHQQECPECGKTFVFTTAISFNYRPKKADCLNDGVHAYRLTAVYPPQYAQLRCTVCDESAPEPQRIAAITANLSGNGDK